MLPAKFGERARVGGIRPPDEVVENPHERRRLHALGLLHLQLEVVVVAERPRETIPQRHQLEKAVIEHPVLDVTERVE